MIIDYKLSGDKINGDEFRAILDVLKGRFGLDEGSTIGELRERVMEEEIDYWAHNTVRNADAISYLAKRLAESEGLQARSEEWINRILDLEKCALSAADGESGSEETAEAA